jgi:transglutaminase-like putative cysteine protease
MKIRFGYELVYSSSAPSPAIFMLHCRPNDRQRLLIVDTMRTAPAVPLYSYLDSFGNRCTRLVVPGGLFRVTADALLEDPGIPEPEVWSAPEVPIGELPPQTLVYLLGSRYCETDLLSAEAWRLFGDVTPGWSRVQAICDFVNQHVTFGYAFARSTKTAWETYRERQGVCRDFAHLAITFCRCLNVPARYSTGYLGDIGVPPVDAPMDFAGAMQVYLGGAWHTFDPRNNARRLGRLWVAHGRDAADVAISTAFGVYLQSFRVWTDELSEGDAAAWLASGPKPFEAADCLVGSDVVGAELFANRPMACE